jgi:hypothetical protein
VVKCKADADERLLIIIQQRIRGKLRVNYIKVDKKEYTTTTIIIIIIIILIYLHVMLNVQWPISESARTAAMRQERTK